MTNYSKTTNFTAKDSLVSGDANKIVKGSEIDAEFDNIATASATKANIASPAFTGVVSFPDGTAGDPSITNTGDTNTGLFFSAADTLAFSAAGTAQFTMADGAIAPVTDNDVDLGTSSLEFKDGYFDGTLYTDAINLDGTAITSTAAEINILDGVTATAAELNILDGVTSTAAELNILDGVTSTAAELNILDGVTSTTAELNILDGVTATTAELNIMDGVTATTAELNIMDGVTSTAAELNILDGVTSTAAELNILDGVTATTAELNYSDTGSSVGTVVASKVVTVDSNKDVASFRNITLTGELDAGSLDISGDADIDGTLETDALSINGTAVTSTAAELNILDGVTSTTAELNILDGVTSTAAELNILDGVTSTAAELNILDGVTSTAAELNILDGVTSTTAELNILDGVTAVTGELNALDLGSTAVGIAIASKAVVLDSNKDFTGVRNFSITGDLSVAGTTTIVDSVQMTANNAVIFEGATADASETTLTSVDATADRTISLPDQSGTLPVLAAVSTTAITSTPEELNLLDGSTANTVVNSKAVIYGSSGEIKATSLDADGGITVDNITIDGTEIDLSSGDLTLDVAGDIILDADGADIRLSDGGTQFGKFTRDSGDFVISSSENDKDMKFAGADGGADITALTLSMQNAGAATFNNTIASKAITATNASGTPSTFNGAANNNTLQIFADTTSNQSFGLLVDAGTSSSDYAAEFRKADNTTIMRIRGDGSVGIGTSSITSGFKLEVTGDARFGDAVGDDAVELGWSSGGSQGFIQAYDRGASAFRDLSINNAVTVTSGGSVGIGITNPTEKFTVVNSSSGIVGRFTNNTNQTLDLGVISGSGASGGVYYNSANSGYHAFQVGGSEAMRISGGNATFSGTVTANAGVVVDNITIDGTEIDLSSGNLTLDVAGNIILDADGGQVILKDGGTQFGNFLMDNSGDLSLHVETQDKDFKITGNDGGSAITALFLNMSEAGEATFNADVLLGDSKVLRFGADQDFRISFNGSNAILQNVTSNSDITFIGKDGSSDVTALTLDMSDAGAAKFNYRAGVGITPRSALDVFQQSNRTGKTGQDRGVLHLQDGDTPANNEITAITFESNSNNASSIIGQSLTNSGSQLFFGTSNSYGSGVTNTALTIDQGGVSTFDVGAIFNESGADVDFRVESDNDTHCLFVDAANDRVIVGASAATSGTDFVSFDAKPGSTGQLIQCGRDDASLKNQIIFTNPNGQVGSVQTSGTATAFNTSSDERLKENITDAEDAGAKVDRIKVRQFDWKTDGAHQDYGMVAQELNEVAPEAVSQGENEGEMWAVDYSKLVPMLVKEIQSLRNRVAELEGE
jgi:hypothetical protein